MNPTSVRHNPLYSFGLWLANGMLTPFNDLLYQAWLKSLKMWKSQPEKLDLRWMNSCYTSLLKSLFISARAWAEEPHYLAYECQHINKKHWTIGIPWIFICMSLYVCKYQSTVVFKICKSQNKIYIYIILIFSTC